MRFRSRALALLTAVAPPWLHGQTRSLAQDSSLDNLRHGPGVVTAAPGTLGEVRRTGAGPRVMLLIPGLGFSAGVWAEFMERYRADHTMYAVTLPGFGGTAPLPMPPAGSRYAEAPWTASAVQGILRLLDSARIERVTVVAQWGLATQIALRLALEHPDRIEAVVLVGGVLKAYYEGSPGMLEWPPERRSAFVEAMAARWFRTVTRTTWDDNNFMPYDYAIHPLRGLFLWREAQAPSLPVWIRYLLEFYSFDQSAALAGLRVPVLVVQPGFDDPAVVIEPGRNYMKNLLHDSWGPARGATPLLEFVTVPGSRLFIQYDQPEALHAAVGAFLARRR